MKSLLAVLALALALGFGYWNYRGADALNASGSAGTAGAIAGTGLVSSLFGLKGNDTSQLEAQLATSQTQLAETNEQLESNKLQLDEALERLENTEKLVESIQAKVNQTELTVGETTGELQQQVVGLGNQLGTIQTDISGMNDAISASGQSAAEQMNAQLDARLASQETKIESFSGELAAINEKIDQSANPDQLETIASTVSELQQEVGTLRSGLATTESSMLASMRDSMDQTIMGLSSSIDERRKIDNGNNTRMLRQSINRLENQIKAVSATSGEAEAAVELSNGLNQRIDAVENSIAGLSDNQAVQKLEQTLNEKIASLGTTVEGLGTTVEGLGTTVGDMDTRVDELGTNINGLSSTVGGIDTTVANLGTTVADVGKSVEALESNITAEPSSGVDATALARISDDSAKLNEQMDFVRKKVAVLESTTKQLKDSSGGSANGSEQLTSIENRLASLESNTDPVAIAAALPKDDNQNSAALMEKVGQLEVSVANLDDTIAAMRTSAAQAAVGETKAIEVSQDRIQEQLTSLESKVTGSAAPSDIANLESELSQSRARIEQLEERLGKLSGSSADTAGAKEFQEKLQQQIADLESRLGNTTAKPDAELISSLDAVRKKVSRLEQQNQAAAKRQVKVLGKPNEYKIYFGKDSSNISGDAQKVLKSFIAQEQNRAQSVSIFGFTDRSGDAAYNQKLALRRANRVRSFLIKQGFDFRKINAVDGLGEDPAASKLDDGTEDANQRTVVLYAYQK